ncbi:MAG: hypothetical protein R3C11_15445 [Planctomycetaceae bacterium]
MVWKRIVSLPFVCVASGFAFLLLSFFVVISDQMGIQIGLFRTLGMNPLAAYAIERVVIETLLPASLPGDAAPWLIWSGLTLFILLIYGMVRGLEKQNIYVRM